MAVILSKWLRGSNAYNNYLIYKNVFWHSIQQSSLYANYPTEYFDHNLYGPLFAVVIAPFALLPDLPGMLAWGLFSMWVLWKGISYFWGPVPKVYFFFLLLLEAVTSLHNLQFNILMAGGLMLAYGFVKKEKEGLAAFLIVVLFLTKIYGIVGFSFLLFSKNPWKFLSYSILWTLFCLGLPVIFSNPSFLFHSYVEWVQTLLQKDSLNQLSFANVGMQDISFMGLVKRVSGFANLSSLWFLIPGALLSLAPFLRFSLHKNTRFQLDYLAQLLIGVVIFSSSSESSTYVIAVSGYLIWQSKNQLKMHWLLFGLVALLTVLSPTDLFPPFVRKEIIVKYALKALPLVVIWFWITKELLLKNYEEATQNES